MSEKNKKPVWFITGCSTGFGHELAKHLLHNGYPTVITARNSKSLEMLTKIGNSLSLKLDITNSVEIDAAVKAAEAHFGHIDVLVNNAGLGYFAAIEESEEREIRQLFEVNMFGQGQMIKAVLPSMRKRRSGFIVNFSCIGGRVGIPALGYYCATKFAIEGLSEALWKEVEPLGIKVMIVEPSGFRTDWAGRSAKESEVVIDDYAQTAGERRRLLRTMSGRQAGDPTLAARAIIAAVEADHPPHRLLLGNAAYDFAITNLEELHKEFSAWEKVSRSADSPKT